MGKPSGFVPGIKYSGHNGQILLDDSSVTITREGFLGRIGSSRELVTIARTDLIGVQHKPASRILNGLGAS